MIDYEITVNVEGFSPEKRKLVQDAFFKLGIFWGYGYVEEYQHLESEFVEYTNTTYEGDVQIYLMHGKANHEAKPTHTFNQLVELAGMGEDRTPDSPVTITISHSELLRMYFVMGRVNGRCTPVPGEARLWEKLTDTIKANYDFEAIEKLRKEFPLPLVDYLPYQGRAEAMMLSAKRQRIKTEIQELKERIAELEAEL